MALTDGDDDNDDGDDGDDGDGDGDERIVCHQLMMFSVTDQ